MFVLKLMVVSILCLDICMYFLGLKQHKLNEELMVDPQKEFMFYSFCPIGYGMLRIPYLKNIYIEEAYSIYRSRYDDEQEIEAHYQCFLAGQISILCIFPVIGAILIMYAIKTGDTMNLVSSIAFTILATVGLSLNGVQSMKKKEKERIEAIKEELPDLINRVVIFLNSGMLMVRVFQNIGGMEENSPLDEEMKRVNIDIINHKDVVYALSRFQRRCPCYEVSRLYSIVEIAVNKGANGVSGMLTNLALELWEEKRNKVKTKSGMLSQKLLIPTFLLFAVVVVLSAVPAFISMKNY